MDAEDNVVSAQGRRLNVGILDGFVERACSAANADRSVWAIKEPNVIIMGWFFNNLRLLFLLVFNSTLSVGYHLF